MAPIQSGAGGGGALTGWRAPQRAQKISCSPAALPHWLQNGIRIVNTSFRPQKFGLCFYDTISTMRAFIVLLCLVFSPLLPAAKNMDVYFIDVEGGQATLF